MSKRNIKWEMTLIFGSKNKNSKITEVHIPEEEHQGFSLLLAIIGYLVGFLIALLLISC